MQFNSGMCYMVFLAETTDLKKKTDEKFFLRNLHLSQNQQRDDNICKRVAYAEF